MELFWPFPFKNNELECYYNDMYQNTNKNPWLYFIIHSCNSNQYHNLFDYRQLSNIRRTKSKKLKRFSDRLAVVSAQSAEAMF